MTWSGSLSWTREDSAPDAGPGQTIVDGTFGAGGYSRAFIATGLGACQDR